jgi:hypothetical protein
MYFLIGISLLFGCFYAVHLAASGIAAAVWQVTRRRSMQWSGRARSNFLCALRIIPLTIASTFTFAFVVPAYVAFEPSVSNERVGYKVGAIWIISAIGFIAALGRIFASWWQTRRLIRTWMRDTSLIAVPGIHLPAYRIDHDFPVLAVVGTFRPRIFVAEKVLAGLDAAELEASVTHEAGHIGSRDNLKRLAMRLCSDLLVFHFAKGIDRDWVEATEAAADETVTTRGLAALDLASALVKIGRLIPEGRSYKLPAGAYLIEPGDASLVARIEALVTMSDHPTAATKAARVPTAVLYLGFLVSIAAVASLSLNATFLSFIHDTTEKVLAALQ